MVLMRTRYEVLKMLKGIRELTTDLEDQFTNEEGRKTTLEEAGLAAHRIAAYAEEIKKVFWKKNKPHRPDYHYSIQPGECKIEMNSMPNGWPPTEKSEGQHQSESKE